MLFTRAFFDPALLFLAALGLGTAIQMVSGVRRTDIAWPGERHQAAGMAVSMTACFIIAYGGTGQLAGTAFAAALCAATVVAIWLALPRLSLVGAQEMALGPLSFLFGAPWTLLLLHEQEFPEWLQVMAVFGAGVGLLLFGFFFAAKLARQALLTHDDWRRPVAAPIWPCDGRRPKVSIHLPAYAEPPEIVIAVLDRLAALDYADFEVLVCDNNTSDEALWHPVRDHCIRLNRVAGLDRFRFFHVAPLAGAKAGALNFLLDHVAPDAELVGVIDADYIAEPDFLSRLTGFFDDPRIGYVQTPHDYRGFRRDPYLTACYWEYMPSNKIEMAGVSEYNAAFTIGTMCLIRTDALNAAGRWAEWCLTEDSEISVRLRALGYDGIYLRETFGRGLIPATFEDYKKQRFRWTAGPVQQLRRHWRLFLPTPLGTESAMRGWPKLLELQRGVEPVMAILGTTLGVLIAGAGTILTAGGIFPVVYLPVVFWLCAAIGALRGLLTLWIRYRLSGCERLSDMMLGELARMSLTYVRMVGGVAGLSRKPLAWRRTPKFDAAASGMRALGATLPETAIGMVHLIVLLVPLGLRNVIGGHFVILVLLAGFYSASRFFAAPAMAMLNEYGLSVRAAPVPVIGHGELMPALLMASSDPALMPLRQAQPSST